MCEDDMIIFYPEDGFAGGVLLIPGPHFRVGTLGMGMHAPSFYHIMQLPLSLFCLLGGSAHSVPTCMQIIQQSTHSRSKQIATVWIL